MSRAHMGRREYARRPMPHHGRMEQIPAWLVPLLPLAGVIVGAGLAYWGQARNAEKAHERTKDLRDAQWEREDAEKLARERAQAGVVVQEARRRMHHAHLEQRALHVQIGDAVRNGRPIPNPVETEARLRLNTQEFNEIYLSVSLFAGELSRLAYEVFKLGIRPTDADPENLEIVRAVDEFDAAAREWLRENTDGPLAQHRYQ